VAQEREEGWAESAVGSAVTFGRRCAPGLRARGLGSNTVDVLLRAEAAAMCCPVRLHTVDAALILAVEAGAHALEECGAIIGCGLKFDVMVPSELRCRPSFLALAEANSHDDGARLRGVDCLAETWRCSNFAPCLTRILGAGH
jgi:hypothetical protein